jgi:hypothetical protein
MFCWILANRKGQGQATSKTDECWSVVVVMVKLGTPQHRRLDRSDER